MKKYFLLIAVFAISIIAIFSCRKSFEPEVNPNQTMNSSDQTELKIQSFLNRLHSDLKDEKTYSIDSAIWYSTASLNYTYAIYDSSLLHISLDTSTFSLDLDEYDKVLESDLEAAIDQMVDSIEVFFNDVDPEDYYYDNAPRDFRAYIYYGDLPWPGPQCLDPDELNFYISSNGIPYIIDDMTPQGLDFISIFVDGKLMWLEDTYLEGHYLDLTFGVLCFLYF